MQVEETFAACLHRLVASRSDQARPRRLGWSASRLALAVGVDASLVRRWLRGDRVPSANSPHVARLAAALELTTDERLALERSQWMSLRARPNRRGGSRGRGPPPRRRPLTGSSTRAAQSGEHDVLPNPEALLESARTALLRLPRIQPHGGTILMLQLGGAGGLPASTLDRWRASLMHAMRRGWDVECLLRLPPAPELLLNLVHGILHLSGGPGHFRVRVFGGSGQSPAPYFLLVVPDLTALLGLASEPNGAANTAISIGGKGNIAVLRDHILHLRRQTTPLVTGYSEDQRLLFDEEQDIACRRGGTFVYLVKDGLSTITVPRDWLRTDATWIRSRAASGQDPRMIVATMLERLERLNAQFAHHSIRTICPMTAIDRWLEKGLDALDVQPSNGVPASPSDRIARVRNAIQMLNDLPGFEIGLWDAATDGALPPAFWQVHDAHTVFVTTWRAGRSGRHELSYLKISHPSVVAAFGLDFEQRWAQLPDARRAKHHVVAWLQARVDAYAGQLSSGGLKRGVTRWSDGSPNHQRAQPS
jgi:transcriptional regulator with XRE-family HTH domain